MKDPATFEPKHFLWDYDDGVATVTFNRPDRKNPLTFESYAELRDTFRALGDSSDVKSVVITGAGGNFCSGGDVHEIIGPLTERDSEGLLEFTTMTGDLIIAIMECPQVVVSAIDGVCVGAGAAVAMASDLRFGTEACKIAFLFVRVGLAGCDMGACSILPRIVGQGRAADLLYSGRVMGGVEAERWGFLNQLHCGEDVVGAATTFARRIADGPTLAHAMTKEMLVREWDMNAVDAVRAEAVAQAKCMETNDFRRAFEAFAAKKRPEFRGN